ncbi:MAG TPA: zinc ribbon domain-containing protein [Blastocatellia bacterium]|nr:zinc ribbon domain-containing protein [Blastocatellia bacterium]
MHCPNCGAEHSPGLRYCKRCGESLSVPTNDLDRQANQSGSTIKRVKQTEHGWDIEEIEPPGINVKKLVGMFWAIAVFGFLSFGVLFGCAIPLMIFGADRKILIPMFMFGSGAIVLIAWLLIQQMSRLVGMVENSNKAARRAVKSPEQDRPQQDRPQIAQPPRSFGSVTEHTTRNFDQVYKEPGARG